MRLLQGMSEIGCRLKATRFPKIAFRLVSFIFWILSAVEVSLNELQDFSLVVLDVFTQSLVAESSQLLLYTIDHHWREYSVLLEYLAELLEAVGRSLAAVWQLCECCNALCVLSIVDVVVNVCLLGDFESVLHLESVTASHAETGDELIDVGRTVW